MRQRRSTAINNNNKTSSKRVYNNEPFAKTKKKWEKTKTTKISIIKQRNVLCAVGFRQKSIVNPMVHLHIYVIIRSRATQYELSRVWREKKLSNSLYERIY